jgi:hypothetical protein
MAPVPPRAGVAIKPAATKPALVALSARPSRALAPPGRDATPTAPVRDLRPWASPPGHS